jgi:hypothetical protein
MPAAERLFAVAINALVRASGGTPGAPCALCLSFSLYLDDQLRRIVNPVGAPDRFFSGSST